MSKSNKAFPFIVGNANLATAIASFHKASQSLQAKMHVIACSVLKHAVDHGDIRPMAAFIQAMPESGRAKALVTWFEEFGPVTFDKMVPTYNKAKREGSNVDAAVALPFWEFAPEPDYKAIDLVKFLQGTIKRLETDAEKTGRDHGPTIGVIKAQLSSLSGKPGNLAS
jgi:hypothetical protein